MAGLLFKDVVEVLLKHNIDIGACTSNGRTAIEALFLILTRVRVALPAACRDLRDLSERVTAPAYQQSLPSSQDEPTPIPMLIFKDFHTRESLTPAITRARIRARDIKRTFRAIEPPRGYRLQRAVRYG